MKKILFRADGSAQTGMGHIMRSLALADMLGEAKTTPFDRRFAIANPPDSTRKLLAKLHIPLVELASNELDELLTHVTADDVVVLDGYQYDESFQRAVRKQAHKLVFIDDLMEGSRLPMWSSTTRAMLPPPITRPNPTHNYCWVQATRS